MLYCVTLHWVNIIHSATLKGQNYRVFWTIHTDVFMTSSLNAQAWWSWSPLCSYDSFHSSRKAFYKILKCVCGIFLSIHAEQHLWGQTLMLDGRCLTRSHLSSSSQRFWMGVEVRALCWPFKFFCSSSANSGFMDLALCAGIEKCPAKLFSQS